MRLTRTPKPPKRSIPFNLKRVLRKGIQPSIQPREVRPTKPVL